MHLEPTGRGTEQREVYDTKRCTGCLNILAHPHARIAHQPCGCETALIGGGHRILTCKNCGTVHLEPPCTRPARLTGTWR